MRDEPERSHLDAVADVVAVAERLDDLAETAELMGDEATAVRLRAHASTLRDVALHGIDHEHMRMARDN